jgi:hypothetical protein
MLAQACFKGTQRLMQLHLQAANTHVNLCLHERMLKSTLASAPRMPEE